MTTQQIITDEDTIIDDEEAISTRLIALPLSIICAVMMCNFMARTSLYEYGTLITLATLGLSYFVFSLLLEAPSSDGGLQQ